MDDLTVRSFTQAASFLLLILCFIHVSIKNIDRFKLMKWKLWTDQMDKGETVNAEDM